MSGKGYISDAEQKVIKVSRRSERDCALARRVTDTFKTNITHRSQSGVDATLVAAMDAWSRKPHQDDVNLFKSMGVLDSTYDSLTRVKIVQIMAVLNRVFAQVGDKAWGCVPSPDPILPEDVIAAIVMKYAMEGIQLAKLKQVETPEEVAEYIALSLEKNESQINEDKQRAARDRVERLEKVLDDILMEAGFTVYTMREFNANLAKFGTAVILGPTEEPCLEMALKGAGDGLKYVPQVKKRLTFRVPSTMSIYPSPGMIEADDGDLCIVEKYNKATLARALSKNAGKEWRPRVIRQILEEYPKGVENFDLTNTKNLEAIAQQEGIPNSTAMYEAVRWFGTAPGAELMELGVTEGVHGKLNEESYYEVEVVVMAQRVIYATVVDDIIGRRVVKTTFYGDGAQFFGYPPSSQIEGCQKLMNITMAALKKQLQMLSIPPIFVNDYSSFVDADRPGTFAMAPGKAMLRTVNSFSQQGQTITPIQPLQFANLIRECISLFEAIQKLADDASGFNRNMLGSGNFSGAARTASGLMQIQEAASIIATFVIGNVDATAIVPMLQKVIAWINRNHPDPKVKGDPQIIARGQLAKVMSSARQQVIAAGYQATQSGIVPQLLGPKQMLSALREYLKIIEFPNIDEIIPDKDRIEFLETMADAERALNMIAGAAEQQQGMMEQSQQGGGMGGEPAPQQSLQQANAQAGMGMSSQVQERRGVA